MPSGTEVAAYRTHEQASAAVELLSERDFPINTVTIVGSDLHLAEKVIGKLTPARVAVTGATQGLTWGLFMSIFSILFYPQAAAVVPMILIVVGVLLGMLINTAAWAFSHSHNPFAARTSMVATRYAILVSEMPDKAFSILSGTPGNIMVQPRRPVRRDIPTYGSQTLAPPAVTPLAGTSGRAGAEDGGGVMRPDTAWDRVTGTADVPSSPAGTDLDRREEAGTPTGPKATEYGSRPDEAPRFGVRVSDEQREQMRRQAAAPESGESRQ